MTHAIDVADPSATKPCPKQGQVWQFYTSQEKAQAAADKLTTKGL